jgi:hypothetical protein
MVLPPYVPCPSNPSTYSRALDYVAADYIHGGRQQAALFIRNNPETNCVLWWYVVSVCPKLEQGCSRRAVSRNPNSKCNPKKQDERCSSPPKAYITQRQALFAAQRPMVEAIEGRGQKRPGMQCWADKLAEVERKRRMPIETAIRNSKRQWYQDPNCGQIRTPNSGFRSCLGERENLASSKTRPRHAGCLPPLLSGETFVKQSQDLGDVELNVFKIKIVLPIFLHLEKVVQLKVQL